MTAKNDTKLIREAVVELDFPISYAYKGDMQEGTFVTLKAPTGKQLVECSELKQAFFQAMSSHQNNGMSPTDEQKEDGAEEITGEVVLSLIAMSTNVKLSSVLLSAKELFANNTAFLDGETKMTRPLLEELHPEDFEKLLGEYFVNFILASWLAKVRNGL